MPITVNEGGTLYTLDTVTANEGGTLYKLDTVYSNEGGVLYEIFGSASTPKTLTWHYNGAPDKTPTVSNNGFTVENSSKNKEYIFSETDGIKLDVFVDKTVTEVFINEEISVTAVGLNEREKLKIISDEANIDYTLYKLKSIRD